MRLALLALLPGAHLVNGQNGFVELDPDLYFDRGITLAAGVKPSAESRWSFLGDLASRKIGPLSDEARLRVRLGGGVRYRLLGGRNNLFGQVNASADQVRLAGATLWQGSLRPGLGVQWHPWRSRGFYVAPLAAAERAQGRQAARPRFEIRVGWQF